MDISDACHVTLSEEVTSHTLNNSRWNKNMEWNDVLNYNGDALLPEELNLQVPPH